MEFIRQFFSTIPEAFAAIWEFGEGWSSVLILAVSLAVIAVFALAALRLRDGHEWLSAVFGVMSGAVAFWWLFGILPSAFVYFVDGERALLEGTLMPGPIGAAEDVYVAFRDLVVVGETAVALGVFILLAVAIQKRFPRGLAEAEEKEPSTGGYK